MYHRLSMPSLPLGKDPGTGWAAGCALGFPNRGCLGFQASSTRILSPIAAALAQSSVVGTPWALQCTGVVPALLALAVLPLWAAWAASLVRVAATYAEEPCRALDVVGSSLRSSP